MKTTLITCAVIVFLPWEINCTITHSPSTFSKHESSSEDYGSSTKGQGSIILSTGNHDVHTTDQRSKDEVPHSKQPPPITQYQHITTYREHKITNGKRLTSHLSTLVPSRMPTKRSFHHDSEHEGTSEGHGSSTNESTILSTRDHVHITDQRSEDGVSHSKDSSPTSQDQHITSVNQTEHNITEEQLSIKNRTTHSRLSSLATSRGQTKRSLEYSGQYTGRSESYESSTRNQGSTTMPEKEQYATKQSLESSVSKMQSDNQSITSISHAEHKNSEAQIRTRETETTSHLSSTATLREEIKTSLNYPQNHQTTSKPQAKQNTLTTQEHITTGEQQTHYMLKSTSITVVTDKHQQVNSSLTEKSVNLQTTPTRIFTQESTLDIITQQPELLTLPQTQNWSSTTKEKEGTKAPISTTGNLTLYTSNSATSLAITSNAQTNDTAPAVITSATEATTVEDSTINSIMTSTGSFTALSPSVNTETFTATRNMKTGKSVTTGWITTTSEPMNKPDNNKATNKNRKAVITNGTNKTNRNTDGNAGPTVAAVIGSALVLMFIAIGIILIRRRQEQKKQLENPDWAGPSPFLESDAQPNMSSHSEDGLFSQRDTKRISLHSFFPQRLSQRLSLLVEEDVQMNNIAANSTFSRNDQPHNGKPAVEDQIQTQKTDNETPVSEVSVPEKATETPVLVEKGNIQQTPKTDEETIPSTCSETSTALQSPPPFEDVDLNPPQMNTEHPPPAPPPPPPLP